jgi:HD-GYP domain-containing protein (c-di-GMP phosphodiesterase class II)
MYQNQAFTKTLEKSIKNHINTKIDNYNDTLKNIPSDIIKKDIKELMKKLDFLTVEIYDENRKEIYDFEAKGKRYQEEINLLSNHDSYLIHNFPDDSMMKTHFFELPNEHYFVQIFYPLYKNGTKLGYIEGISYLDTIMVNRFKRGIVATIITVVFTVIILGSLLFPIIYFAYKKLEDNRKELLSSNIMTLNTLGNAIALRDSDTNEHNYRVTIYAIHLAEHLQIEPSLIKPLIKGAFLHDVGKIGISDNILLKNGKLDEKEFEIMKQHVQKGVELISGNSWLEQSKEVIIAHHEKYDGTGYPNKLKGEEIPLIARIFSIVDVFDALTSERPYKEPFSYEKSIKILQEEVGSHFDPTLAEAFFHIAQQLYEEIRLLEEKQLKQKLDQLTHKYFLIS